LSAAQLQRAPWEQNHIGRRYPEDVPVQVGLPFSWPVRGLLTMQGPMQILRSRLGSCSKTSPRQQNAVISDRHGVTMHQTFGSLAVRSQGGQCVLHERVDALEPGHLTVGLFPSLHDSPDSLVRRDNRIWEARMSTAAIVDRTTSTGRPCDLPTFQSCSSASATLCVATYV
jgi:hypothetical protein